MKTPTYKAIDNAGHLKPTGNTIDIRRGRWIDPKANVSHPMKFKRKDQFYAKRVYFLYRFGDEEKGLGVFISLSVMENQRFLWLQKKHWLQQETNLKYILGILLSSGALAWLLSKLFNQ